MVKYEFIDKALWFPEQKILVISDLHIGFEDWLNASGIFLPRFQFKQIFEDLKKIFSTAGKVQEVIINGDLKHEFGLISDQEWYETQEILDFLKEKSKKVVLVKGNHDSILEPIARRKEIEIRDFYVKNDVCFMHGGRLFSEALEKKIKILVLGHRHPAIVLSDRYKQERYKCFLAGKWKGKNVVVLPSFFPLVEGSDVLNIEENNKMFIPESKLRGFEVFAVGDKVYRFGKVKKIY